MIPLFRSHASTMRKAHRLERAVRVAASQHGVSMPASGLYVLMLLDQRSPLSITDIAKGIDWTENPSYVINLLAKKGLIERSLRPSDRRLADCAITPLGGEKMRQIIATLEGTT